MEPDRDNGIVQVQKLDPQGRKTIVWAGRVLEHTAEHILLCALFNRSGRDLGYVVLERGDLFLEWYYFARWYNVFQIYSRAGALKGWYCNIGRPPELAEGELRYVDLALDVFVGPDGDHLVLDADEFAELKAALLSPEDAARAEAGLAELVELVVAGRLPSYPYSRGIAGLAQDLPGLVTEG
jgi:hypothetical protein